MPIVLTLDLAKQWLRYEIEDDGQDATLALALRAGQEWVERQTGLLLTRREVRQPASQLSGSVALLWGPNADTVAVDYIGSDGTTGAVGDARVVQSDSFDRGALWPAVGASWPAIDHAGGAIVTYTAGYADADDVPGGLLEAMLVYAGMRDEQRTGGEGSSWAALWAIIQPYRTVTV